MNSGKDVQLLCTAALPGKLCLQDRSRLSSTALQQITCASPFPGLAQIQFTAFIKFQLSSSSSWPLVFYARKLNTVQESKSSHYYNLISTLFVEKQIINERICFIFKHHAILLTYIC